MTPSPIAGHRRLGIHVQPDQRRSRGTVANVSISGSSSRSGARISFASSSRAEHGAVDDDDLAAAEELRDLRQRRDLQHPGRGADRVRRRLRPLDVAREHLRRPLPGPDHHPGDELVDRVERDLHRDDDAEAAAAAAQRPEQVGVLRPVGAHERAVGGDELDGEHALGREAVHAGQPADAAAERVADDADVRGRAVQRGEAVLGRPGTTTSSQSAPASTPGPAVLGVDLDAAHLAHVEQERPVERARATEAPWPVPWTTIRRSRSAAYCDGVDDVLDGGRAARRRRGAGRRPGSTPGGRRRSGCRRGRRTGGGSVALMSGSS